VNDMYTNLFSCSQLSTVVVSSTLVLVRLLTAFIRSGSLEEHENDSHMFLGH